MRHAWPVLMLLVVGLTACARHDRALTTARETLDTIEDHRDWVAGAVELSAALNAWGNRQEAVALLRTATKRAGAIEDTTARAKSVSEIATAMSALGSALELIDEGHRLSDTIGDDAKRWDIKGKLTSALAASGQADAAFKYALAMPDSNFALASYKARTLREIALHQAKAGEPESATKTIASITMGLRYYQATARTDVAREAADGHSRTPLIDEAVEIARGLDNGYFVAGALRDVGEAYADAGLWTEAKPYFDEAITAARTAPSHQEQARALSRVATGMADFGRYELAVRLIPEALAIAEKEEKESLRIWSFYEIAGSFAFAGDFNAALALLDRIPAIAFGSSQSLKSAALRDIAWGMARHGRIDEAVERASAIETRREKVQALSRILRVMKDPNMAALSRYL